MFFRRVFGSAVDSKSKNFEGETLRHLPREIIRSKDGCLSPRSILPRCFTSMSTFSATCQIFSFLDLRTERTSAPNCDAGLMRLFNLDNNRATRNEKPPQKSLIY